MILFFLILILVVICTLLFLNNGPVCTPRLNGIKVAVGLTTIPERLGQMDTTIQSLLHQTYPIDAIIVSVPYYSARRDQVYDMSKISDNVKSNVHIHRTHDYGPATKVVGLMEYVNLIKQPGEEWWIMWCDDDNKYNRHTVETYVEKLNMYPHSAVCVASFEKHVAYSTHDGDSKGTLEGFAGVMCRYNDMPDLSLAYKPVTAEMYHHQMTSIEKDMFHSDDYTISYYLRRHGINLIKVSTSKYNWKIAIETEVKDASNNNGLHLLQDHLATYGRLRDFLEPTV